MFEELKTFLSTVPNLPISTIPLLDEINDADYSPAVKAILFTHFLLNCEGKCISADISQKRKNTLAHLIDKNIKPALEEIKNKHFFITLYIIHTIFYLHLTGISTNFVDNMLDATHHIILALSQDEIKETNS